MKRLLLLVLLVTTAGAATVFRVDPAPVMTTAGIAPPGGFPALYAVAGASINICNDSACATPATTYTDATGATACPLTSPIVLAGTSLCVTSTGPQGQFGFWVAPGTYYYKITFPSGQSFGNFPLTSNTAGVTALTGGTGISVSASTGNVTVTNTGIITITAGTGLSSTGGQNPTFANTGLLTLTAGTGISSTGGQSPTIANTGVLSFNTRTGAVTPATNDYTYSQIGGAVQGNTTKPQMAGTNSGATGAQLCDDANGNATTSGCTAGGVTSFNTRTGAVVPATNDYSFSQISGTAQVAQGGTGVTSAQGVGDAKVQLAAGSTTTGDCLKYDAAGGAIDNGSPCNNFSLPSGLQTQYLQLKPNSGNTTTVQFASLPLLNTLDYLFPTQSPTTPSSLAIGANSVTMVPVPLGMNGSDTNHYVYVAGTGTPEDCLITGGSGTSGQASGTIIITCAGTHSAGYTIGPSTIGIQEAIIAGCAAGGARVIMPAGTFNLNSGFTVTAGCNISLRGQGEGTTYLNTNHAVVGSPGLTGTWMLWDTGSGVQGSAADMGDFSLGDTTNTNHTAGAMVQINTRFSGLVSNFRNQYGWDAFICSYCEQAFAFFNVHFFAAQYGLEYIGTQTQSSIGQSIISGGSAGLFVNGSQTVGLYITGSLFDDTATGGTSASSAIRLTESGTNAINEVVISGSDLESIGDGLEYNGVGGSTYLNNSLELTGSRLNTGTECLNINNQVNGIHFVGNYCTVSTSNAQAGVVGNGATDLTIANNRFLMVSPAEFIVQAAGSNNNNWIIQGNSRDAGSSATFTSAVALTNSMDSVTITGNDFSGIAAHVNAVTGLTHSRIAGNNGLQVFGSLPACASGLEGSDASVTDSTTNTWGGTITGSGSDHVKAYCDGTNWTVYAK